MLGTCAQAVQDRSEWTKFASLSADPDAIDATRRCSRVRVLLFRPGSRNTLIHNGDCTFDSQAEDAARDLTATQNKTNNSARSGKISPARLA
jgi:hypothetical protein